MLLDIADVLGQELTHAHFFESGRAEIPEEIVGLQSVKIVDRISRKQYYIRFGYNIVNKARF